MRTCRIRRPSPWWLLAFLVPLAARAETLDLPATRGLDRVEALRVVLDGAEIDVVVDAEAPQSLRAEPLGSERPGADGDPEPPARLSLQTHEGRLTLGRLVDGGAERDPVRVELVIHPRTELAIIGRDLTVTGAGSGRRDAAAEDDAVRRRDRDDDRQAEVGRTERASSETDGSPAGRLQLDLEASSVDLFGVVSPRIELDGGFVALDQTRGRATLTINGGTLTVGGHEGPLDGLATDSSVTVDSVRGELQLDLLGGTADVLGGVGLGRVTAREASLRLVRRQGPLIVALEGATLELADLGTPTPETARGGSATRLHSLQLEVRSGSRLSLDRVAGALSVVLEDAALEATELEGRLEVEARGDVDLALRDVRAAVRVEQTGGRVALSEVDGPMQLTLTDLSLDLDAVRGLTLQGRGLELTGSGVASIGRVALEASSVDLDLTAVDARRLALRFVGPSDVSLTLPAPCVVQFQSVEEAGSGDELEVESVDVTGCDLRLPEQPLRSIRTQQRYGREPLTAILEIDAEVDLRVRGR